MAEILPLLCKVTIKKRERQGKHDCFREAFACITVVRICEGMYRVPSCGGQDAAMSSRARRMVRTS